MIRLTADQIDRALPRIRNGLTKYSSIQNEVMRTDVSRDRNFQGRYIHFYKVRRNRDWLNKYFTLMEVAKSTPLSFEEALQILKQQTNRYEASFASKLIATIDVTAPVIDKFVLENVQLKLPYNGANERQERICEVYSELKGYYIEFAETVTGQYLFDRFEEIYPPTNVSKTKMIDLVLWQTRC